MAYASVASLLQTIDLVNYHDDSSISSRFNDLITSLHKHASFLQSFLEDDDPNRAKNWEETIREVADRAEEIIDLLVSDSLLESSESELDSGLGELEKVREEMESTAKRVKGRSTKPKAEPDEELMEIVTRLRQGSDWLEKIAIVGLAGSGKSSLARNAYNHPSVVKHFDVRASSTVSRQRSPRRTMLDLLRSVNKSEGISSLDDDDEELVDTLYRSLRGKRYLIVLYDVWDVCTWEMIRFAFPLENGGRIILTTRDSFVADRASSDHVHMMRFLDDNQSWNLLREKVFKGDPCPFQLESIGKTIARSCDGIPLSIELVSIILGDDQTEAAWGDIAESIKDVFMHDLRLKHILYLNYTHLPHHLRPCLLYLATFPEGRQIRVSRLVKLWEAEGFLRKSGSKSIQELLEYLVRRSLVSVSKRKSNGGIKSITIHESMQDVCKTQAIEEHFCFHGKAAELELESCRRVSSSKYSHDFLEGVYDSTIRTIILNLNHEEEGVRLSMGNVRLLRILDLSNAHDYDLPEEVFHLFHLRYLAFHTGFSISEAISNLQNLQTLIVYPREENGRMVHTLPEGIWRIPQLRHLFNFSFKLPIPTLKQGENSALENLQTLSRVVDFVCSRENLKLIPNVTKLSLLYTKELRDVVEDYELHNLINLQKLEVLKLDTNFSLEHNMSFATFPLTLKKLSLCGLQLSWKDMEMVASLPNLEVLKLRNHACIGEIWVTSEGGFSHLKYLMIEESNLALWMSGASHFPKLESLVLHRCVRLLRVPTEIGRIPTLEVIEMDDTNSSLLRSAKQILEDRRSLEDDRLRILVV